MCAGCRAAGRRWDAGQVSTVITNIGELAGAAEETRQGAQGTSDAAEELAAMASTLDRLVGDFRY